MASLASDSPSLQMKIPRRSFARKCERYCCNTITYFPLVFVYGLTSWAVWVQATVGFAPKSYGWTGYPSALLGICLYILLNWSYTVAVFTDPGSPLTQTTNAYSVLPSTDEDPELDINGPLMSDVPVHASLTVKSTGEARYCKKCHTRKPDRAHHCSTCRRCVLKMDHHCPWLATCVGFRNYKPFLLFLVYVCLFCWVCFFVCGSWVMSEIFGELQVSDQLMPVNYILLAVLSGILGLVLTGFTSWHLYLACRGQTTIESLEATRYLTPLRKAMEAQGHDAQNNHERIYLDQDHPRSLTPEQSLGSQLRTIHANVLPGITRPEEGVETPSRSSTPSQSTSSPAHAALRRNLNSNPYNHASEAERERARYSSYLDEVDSSKLPHAFDLGWRRNLRHLFGERLLLAWLPICNSTGDGWNWEPSPKWLEASAQLARDRANRQREEVVFERDRHETMGKPLGKEASRGHAAEDEDDVPLGRRFGKGPPSSIPPRYHGRNSVPPQATSAMENWNDIPEEFLTARAGAGPRSRSRGSPVSKDNLGNG